MPVLSRSMSQPKDIRMCEITKSGNILFRNRWFLNKHAWNFLLIGPPGFQLTRLSLVSQSGESFSLELQDPVQVPAPSKLNIAELSRFTNLSEFAKGPFTLCSYSGLANVVSVNPFALTTCALSLIPKFAHMTGKQATNLDDSSPNSI